MSKEFSREVELSTQLLTLNTGNTVPDQIELYLHCSRRLHEMPLGVTAEQWARINVGFTKNGIQIWCVRHDINIARFNFHQDIRPHDIACAACQQGIPHDGAAHNH